MSSTAPFNSNLTEVFYKVEKTPGIEQTHGVWVRLRIRSESMRDNKSNVVTRNLSTSREPLGISFSQDAPTGSVTCLLSPTDLDTLFESTMRNSWNAKQLQTGEIERTFSVLVHNRDHNNNSFYTLYTGCVFNDVSFTFQINSYVTFSFNVIGTGVELNHQLDSRAVFSESSGNEQFVGRDGTITKDGIQVGFISSLTGSFGHSYEALKRLNFAAPFALRAGQFDATASMSGAFADTNLITEYIEETSFELLVTLQYKQDIYRFIFPRCVITEANYASAGQGALILNANVQPLLPSNRGSTVILRKERT